MSESLGQPAPPHSSVNHEPAMSPWAQGITRWGPVILLIVGMFMAAISWLKWANPRVDYGAQVYVPWQISEGKVLYRDINYIYGPLASYIHGFLFTIFGSSIRLLMIFNLSLVALITFSIYQILKKVADGFTATWAGVAFLTVFAMAEFRGGGTFNYVCAYNYDLTHGAAISYFTLYMFLKYLEKPSTLFLSGLGILAGMVYLTKPEMFLALFTSLSFGIALALYFKTRSTNQTIKNLMVYFLFFLLAPFLFWLYFSFHVPAMEALRYIFIPWLQVANDEVRNLPFYRWVLGIDDLVPNIFKMVGMGLTLANIIVYVFLIENQLHPYARKHKWIYPLAWVILFGPVLFWVRDIFWLELARPLPFFATVMLIYYFYVLSKAIKAGSVSNYLIFSLTFSLFAFIVLFKIIFNTTVYHYGYVLSVPAFILFVKFFLHDLTDFIRKKFGTSNFYQLTATALLVIFILVHVNMAYKMYQIKNYRVGSGADTLLDYGPFYNNQGEVINEAVDYINTHLPPEAEYPVLPAGALLNYLPRRANPLPFLFFTPTEIIIFTEDRYIRELEANPPPYIVIQQMDHIHLGARYFGKDYGVDLHKWIMSHYHLEKHFGVPLHSHKPFGRDYGIEILKRNPSVG